MSEENTLNTGESCCCGGAAGKDEDESWINEFEDYGEDDNCPFCNIEKGRLILMALGALALLAIIIAIAKKHRDRW